MLPAFFGDIPPTIRVPYSIACLLWNVPCFPVNPWQMMRKESLIPEREKVIYNALHCSPCVHLSISPPCNGNNICIKEIDQNQILNSVAEIIPALHS